MLRFSINILPILQPKLFSSTDFFFFFFAGDHFKGMVPPVTFFVSLLVLNINVLLQRIELI